MLRQLVNHRINPFTGTAAYSVITNEAHAIPGSGTYRVRLNEVPDENYTHATSGSPLYIRTVGGTTFSEVGTSPGINEFRVDYTYKTGWVEFNSANADDIILCDYRGTGSPTEAGLINTLQMGVPPVAEFMFGDGSDLDTTISSNTSLSAVSGGLAAFKQCANLTINTGITLSLNSAAKGMVLCVSGILTLNSSAIISVSGNGAAGGGSTSTDGLAGGAGAYGGGAGGVGTSGAGGAGGGNDPGPFCAGHGVGGASSGADGAAPDLMSSPHHWRDLRNLMVYGAGGGGGGGKSTSQGYTGGAGGGWLVVYANVLDVSSGARFDASGADGKGGGTSGVGAGGGGAGGTVLVVANRIVGATGGTLESTYMDVTGGAGGIGSGNGGDGAAGYKKAIELYSYNVR